MQNSYIYKKEITVIEPLIQTVDRAEQIRLIETFPNPNPERDYVIHHICHEFTSVCPKTGQPDFATIELIYTPEETCLELKSLKFYLQAYRNQGIFYEAVTNRILTDLAEVCKPRSMKIVGNFAVRGGWSSVITAEHKSES